MYRAALAGDTTYIRRKSPKVPYVTLLPLGIGEYFYYPSSRAERRRVLFRKKEKISKISWESTNLLKILMTAIGSTNLVICLI